MKHVYLLLFCICLTLASHAQSFTRRWPLFLPGPSYQLTETGTPGDTTHILRLQPGTRLGPDSVYQFVERATKGRPAGNLCGSYVQRLDNLFGSQLRMDAAGTITLSARNGNALVLKPRAALGQTWAATATGITCQVVGRSAATVLGRPDSVATIRLSDGAVLHLSRTWGLLDGPALGRYLSGSLPGKHLTLTALPEVGLGSSQLGFEAVYNFQPGDVFLRQGRYHSVGGVPDCYTFWQRDSVLTRRTSGNGDTLVYTIWTRRLQQLYTYGSGCQGPATPRLEPAQVVTRRYLRTAVEQPYATSYAAPTARQGAYLLHGLVYRTAAYNARAVQQHGRYAPCTSAAPDSLPLFDMGNLDFGYRYQTAVGLGLVQEDVVELSGSTTTLVGYRKGAEQWGTLTQFSVLLPTRREQVRATTATFPNPFGQELTIRLETRRAQLVTVELYNSLGQRVVQRQHPAGAGVQQLALPTPQLAAGLYQLRLTYDAHSETLPVLRAE